MRVATSCWLHGGTAHNPNFEKERERRIEKDVRGAQRLFSEVRDASGDQLLFSEAKDESGTQLLAAEGTAQTTPALPTSQEFLAGLEQMELMLGEDSDWDEHDVAEKILSQLVGPAQARAVLRRTR